MNRGIITSLQGRLRMPSLRDDKGQGLVEYALIISVVALGTIAALVFLRDEIKGLFSKAGSSISVAAGPSSGGPPVGSAPSGGTASLTCSATPCEDDEPGPDDILTITTSWSGSPTGYTYQWQSRQDDAGNTCTTNTGYANVGGVVNSASNSVTLDPPNSPDDLCYQVVITATNGSGTGGPITSNRVHVNDN